MSFSHVFAAIRSVFKCPGTKLAGMWTFSCVSVHMITESCGIRKSLVADITEAGLLVF